VTRLFYKVHKWIGVGIGLILLMWIVTGVLLGGGGGGRAPEVPDYSRATVSPAAAQAAAAVGDSGIAEVRGLTLDAVAGRVVYRINGPRGRTALIDAATGDRVAVGEPLAREVAAALAPGVAVRGVVLLRANDRGYPRGSLPVWRVMLDDPAESWVHLASDGSTTSNTRVQRGKAVLHDLHTFAALQTLHFGRRSIRVLFVLASVVSIALVITGYYLSLPRRWRSFRAVKEES